MLDILLWIAVGAFVGWNFPQPEFAKNIQKKVYLTEEDYRKITIGHFEFPALIS